MKKEFHEIIKEAALKWARKNAIAMPGEIVETIWGDWKKPHKVIIYSVGCHLCAGDFDRQKWEFKAELEMAYCGLRIYPKQPLPDKNPGCGLVLNNFKKTDGVLWRSTKEGINNATVHWELPESWPYVPEEG